MSFDPDQFEERAAIAEFDGALSRFDAETLAAREQGLSRWKAMEMVNAVSKRDLPGGGNIGAPTQRNTANAVPAMQPDTTQEARSLPIGNVQDGRGSVALLALPVSGGRVL